MTRGRLVLLCLHLIGAVCVAWPAFAVDHGWSLGLLIAALAGWAALAIGGPLLPPAARTAAWGAFLLLGATAAGLGSAAASTVIAIGLLSIILHAPRAFPGPAVWAAAATVAFLIGWERTGADATHGWAILISGLIGIGLGTQFRQSRIDRARRVDDAVSGERARLARDIHDVLAHSLGGLTLQLDALEAVAENRQADPEVQERIQRARQMAADGLIEARHAVDALRAFPERVDEAIAEVVDRARNQGQPVRLEITGDPRRLSSAQSAVLASVAVEALTNARKHAPGAPVSVDLRLTPRHSTLTVANPAGGERTGTGHGIRGMRERADLIGAALQAGEAAGQWVVTCTVPR